MTREEFESKTFDELIRKLNEEDSRITHIDILKEFIKSKIDEDNFYIASHLCNAIWNDPNPLDSDWYDYDYSLGTLDTPVCLACKDDIEYLIDD